MQHHEGMKARLEYLIQKHAVIGVSRENDEVLYGLLDKSGNVSCLCEQAPSYTEVCMRKPEPGFNFLF